MALSMKQRMTMSLYENAKQRNGPVGAVNLTYVRSLTRFENYAKDLD